jgi:hypothetical protein
MAYMKTPAFKIIFEAFSGLTDYRRVYDEKDIQPALLTFDVM